MDFELKTTSQGHIYLPKRLRETLGTHLKLLPNTRAAVIYPFDAEPEDVIKSLQLLIADLQLRVERKEGRERLTEVPNHEAKPKE